MKKPNVVRVAIQAAPAGAKRRVTMKVKTNLKAGAEAVHLYLKANGADS